VAVENRHDEMVRLLVENGANVEAEDKNGRTALHKATDGGPWAVVQLLTPNRNRPRPRARKSVLSVLGIRNKFPIIRKIRS
jgi:ankyrin repeat protein